MRKSMNFYCYMCSPEAEPFYYEPLVAGECTYWDNPTELDTCPAHGDSKKLRLRVTLPKKHPLYVPKGRVLRWKADGEFDWSELGDEEGVEVTA